VPEPRFEQLNLKTQRGHVARHAAANLMRLPIF
jgi:hypothetical protein